MKKIQKKIVILMMLLIVLCTLSTINAKDIMANPTTSDSILHESHKDTTQTISNTANSKNKQITKNDLTQTTNSNLKSDNTTNTKNNTKTLKAKKNENNILSANDPEEVEVHNSTELANLFKDMDSLGIKSKSLIINFEPGDYKLTKNNTISRAKLSPNYFELRNLTINGNNQVIDGDNLYNFIYFDFDERFGLVTVTINNLTIKNCKFSNGGAIYSWGGNVNLTINDCVFDNNVATSESGAIRFAGGTLNIINSNFTNNTATNRAYSAAGAVYSGSPLTVINSRFEDNKACQHGGAIHTTSDVIINNSVFIHNSLYQESSYAVYGGAVSHGGPNCMITIIDSNFTENSVTNTKKKKVDGGAVYAQGVLNITNSNFEGNIANSTSNSFGGAIYSEKDHNIINSSKFTSNNAYLGGALFVEYTLDVDNSNFIANTAVAGGAIYSHVKNPGSPIFYEQSIHNSNFTSNTASNSGGAIFTRTNLTLTGSNITNNHAPTGGAIYIDNASYGNRNVSIIDNIFRDNYVTINSGWVVYLNKATTIHDNLFVNNTLDRTRDMLFNVLGESVNGNTYIDNYLIDSWDSIIGPIELNYNQEKTVHLVNLRDVYNNTIVNGTIACYLEDSSEPFATFNVTNGNADLKFNKSELLGEHTIKIRYTSWSRHYQDLDSKSLTIKLNEPINVTVKKNWIYYHDSPDFVTVNITNDAGDVVGTLNLTKFNGWENSTELPKYDDNGIIINYTVKEVNVPNYKCYVTNTSAYNFTLTNIELVNTLVRIDWNDNNDKDHARPGWLSVNITNDAGDVVSTLELTQFNAWMNSTELPKYDDNGILINYTIKEVVEIPSYISNVTKSGDEFIITYTKTVTVTVVKRWNDSNNWDGIRPDMVTVNITNDTGHVVSILNLTKSDLWTNSTVLPKYINNILINYTVIEESIPGYSPTISKNGYDFTVTNTHKPETVIVKVVKFWDDGDNRDGIRPDMVTVNITNDTGDVVGTLSLTKFNGWTNSIELPKYINNILINYTVTEVSIRNYSTSISNNSYTFNVTNTHKPETVTVNLVKVWNDNNNQDGIRPDRVTVNIVNKDTGLVVSTLSLTKFNGWKNSTELYKFSNGALINYTVSEKSISKYSTTVSNKSYNFTVTNTHKPETVSVNVVKVWSDGDNQDGVRPDRVTVSVWNKDTKVMVGQFNLTRSVNWRHSFTNLPKYSNGALINYTVREESIPKYSTSITNNSYDFTVTNTHRPEVVSLDVATVWSDNNNQDGLRPKNVVVSLTANGVVKTNKTLNKANNWKATFNDLPKYNKGVLIKYNFTETVPYYTSTTSNTGNEFTVTNTHKPATVSVNVVKVWSDNKNQDGIRPDRVTVSVWNKDTKAMVGQFNLTRSVNWRHSFTNLPKFSNGALINYTVREESIPKYSTTITNKSYTFTVTNSHRPATVSVNVVKVWSDNKNQDGIRPDSVTVGIWNKDTKVLVDHFDLTESVNWRHSFTNLPKFSNGALINYTVREESIPKYTSSIVNKDYNFTVTNTHRPEVVSLDVATVWSDNNNQDGLRPKNVVVSLTANGVVKATRTLNGANNWKATFDDLPKYHNGVLIKYDFTESVSGYNSTTISTPDGFAVINSHRPEVVSLDVATVWSDNKNQDGVRPDSVVLVLTANGVVKATRTLDESNNWKATFDDLPKYHNGVLIKYDFTESVSGYNSTTISTPDGFAVINAHKPEVVDVNVGIVWPDNSSHPDTLRIQLYANGKSMGKPVTTTNNSYVFKNLAKYSKGKLINYTIELLDLPSGYTAKTTGKGYNFVITLEGSVKKIFKWSLELFILPPKNDTTKNHTHHKENHTSKKAKYSHTHYKYGNNHKRHGKHVWKHYHHRKNNYYPRNHYKFRLYISLYKEYMNGTLTYDDFVAILKSNDIKVSRDDWDSDGKISVDYDDIDDVPDKVTLHNKNGDVPDSTVKIDKSKAKRKSKLKGKSKVFSKEVEVDYNQDKN